MKESTTLRQAALDFYAALNAKDIAGVEKGHSLDPTALAVGTAADEYWVGGRNIVDLFQAQFDAMPALTFEAGPCDAYEAGDVGWFVDRPTIRGLESGPVELRLTAVAVRETGTWKILQSHLSVGVPN